MRVVVTGGLGKLGQYVVRALTDARDGREPHQVTVFDAVRGPEDGPVRYLPGDVLDLGQVFQALAGADAVIHLAAVRKHGIATNDVVLRTNALGTFNVHEAAWRLGIRRVVLASSESIMGWDYAERPFLPDYLPVDEDHPVRPQDSYGLSKQIGEAIARSYTAKCDMETVALRPPWIVTPEALAALRRQGGRPPDRFVLCNYVDVRDLAAAFRLAVERPIRGHHVLHVCADDSRVAEPLCELFPRLLPAIGDLAHDLTGSRPATNTARAKALLGWQPQYSWRRPEE
ncbi:MAG TPA: NAD(P)-dependent oxidoreductase [Chloroflexota bacterium]|nr:NAD(P)-dependent oxidoreductase [Chloroflexota bacterium]